MAIYYLIRGNAIIQEIDDSDVAMTALPVLGTSHKMSLINRAHIVAIIENTGFTVEQIIAKLGLVDEREP